MASSSSPRPSAPIGNSVAMGIEETHLGGERGPQAMLSLCVDGVQRYVWESRFGPILIEVIGDDAFVNGQRVQPAPAPA